MIPKIIHYCWFGQKDKPALVKKSMESWKRFLPDWEIIEWNENNSPLNIAYVHNALKVKRYAFAADYVRFYALKNMGGIYLDTDIELLKDLSSLLHHQFFIGKESDSMINAAIMGSVKNGRLVNLILSELESRDSQHFDSIPKIVTNTINKHNGLNDGEVIYETDYFYPYNPFDNERNEVKQLFFSDITENTYAIHHWQQSWHYTYIERLINRVKRFVK
ncbi:glycosyltransferase family 32 protein [Citrobacter portucalensis]|uniref:glycosyltransferase family 32 protein n=1 Tax=Citrobacter portucalensis TaxID=1639133 RepID=UPI0028C1FDAD|nr:glycosyltransferase [Citrobacter portucalensis]